MVFPAGFDRDQAIKLGNLIQNAYEEYDKNPHWEPTGYKVVQGFFYKEKQGGWFVKKADEIPFGFIATDDNNNYYIVFRGTRTPIEWLRDFEIVQTPYLKGWGKTTVGFSQIYQQLQPAVHNALHNASPSSKIYVTGHSLGCALATLCVPDIITNFPELKNLELYTFASPRTGDIDFAQAYSQHNIKTWRIANTEDLVTSIPFPSLALANDNLVNALKYFIPKSSEHFQHVGISVSFTVNKGDIADNHDLIQTYLNFLKSDQ